MISKLNGGKNLMFSGRPGECIHTELYNYSRYSVARRIAGNLLPSGGVINVGHIVVMLCPAAFVFKLILVVLVFQKLFDLVL